jgi:hypothetical protein
MPLTKEFQETVRNRATTDTEFRSGLLTEALNAAIRGEWEVAKILLRDYKVVSVVRTSPELPKPPKTTQS